MALTTIAIQSAKSAKKPYKQYDEKGLFLLVTPSGGKWWRFKYRFGGKEKLLSLGIYPEISLKDARERRDAAREQIAHGTDPSASRKEQIVEQAKEITDTFEAVGREWVDKQSAQWAESHSSKILRRLELDVFPYIGKRQVGSIKPPELLQMLRRIEERGAVDTAHRALQNCGQIFRYAVVTGRAERDIAADLHGALAKPKEGHFAAVTDPKEIGGLLRTIRAYKGQTITRCALRLMPLVFVRPGELRKAEWPEIDFKTETWNIPAERMKMRQPHIVPLSHQAMAALKELHAVTGEGQFLFPSARSKKRPMSDNAVLGALRRMGIGKEEMSGHGFRAMARTVMDEVLQVRPDYIEHQLAHAVRDPNGRAYNRTAHLDERRKMMQRWADYLDELVAAVPDAQPTAKAAGWSSKGKK